MGVEVEVEMEDSKDKKKSKYGKFDEWKVEDAARTLMEAEKIKSDKELMKYVSQCMREKADHMDKAITSLDDLKKVAYGNSED